MNITVSLGRLWVLADNIDQNYNKNRVVPSLLSPLESALYVYSSIIQLPRREERLKEVLDNHKITTSNNLLVNDLSIALSFKPAEWDDERKCKIIKGYCTLDYTADFLTSYCNFLNDEYGYYFSSITALPEVKTWSTLSPVSESLCLTLFNSTFAELKKFEHENQILSTPIPIRWASDYVTTLNETFPLNTQDVRKWNE